VRVEPGYGAQLTGRGSADPGAPTGVDTRTCTATGSGRGAKAARDPNGSSKALRAPSPLVDATLRLDERPGMSNYWPWWAGAAGLALVTINYTLITDRSLGVSSAWDRVVHWRTERKLERQEAQFADERALVDVLRAATVAHFGASPAGSTLPADPASGDAQTPGRDVKPVAGGRAPITSLRPAPLVTQAALLVSIFLGGLVAAVVSGRFQVRLNMGGGFGNLVTNDSTTMIIVLFAGGILVGFGTRLAGGCSSGHGLSGCGRLRPVSLLATAVFFGTAVLVSFLLWKVI
jgi:hypothetical protein